MIGLFSQMRLVKFGGVIAPAQSLTAKQPSNTLHPSLDTQPGFLVTVPWGPLKCSLATLRTLGSAQHSMYVWGNQGTEGKLILLVAEPVQGLRPPAPLPGLSLPTPQKELLPKRHARRKGWDHHHDTESLESAFSPLSRRKEKAGGL